MKNKKAQSIAEYALLISVVAAAISAMSLYIKRTVQAGVKVTVDKQLVEEFGIITSDGGNLTLGEQAQILGMSEFDKSESGTPLPVFSRSQVQPNSATTLNLRNGNLNTEFSQRTTSQGSSQTRSTGREDLKE